MFFYDIDGNAIEVTSTTNNSSVVCAKDFMKAINHRGYNTVAPENTIPAFKLSQQKGFEYVECDVGFTKDKVPVLLHDDTIDRTSNGSGNINSLTYSQVSQYDFGSWKSAEYAGTKIPTFEEFIKLCKDIKLKPYVEIKNNAAYTKSDISILVEIAKRQSMTEKITWISFNKTFLLYIKELLPDARLGFVCSSFTVSDYTDLKNGSNDVFIDTNLYDSATIQYAFVNGIPLELWTINDESTIKSLDRYITGVTSDNLKADDVICDNALGA